MSILINMDEMLYSTSSCNVILERKNAKQLWQQERKQRVEQQQMMYQFARLHLGMNGKRVFHDSHVTWCQTLKRLFGGALA